MPTKYDACPCGNMKDTRSKRCRKCFERVPTMKKCPRCERTKAITHFTARSGVSRHGVRAHCRACENDYARDRRNAPDYVRPERTETPEQIRLHGLRARLRRYGCPDDALDAWVARYESATTCDACGMASDEPLHIDHCHDANVLRGILCRGCNVALGHVNDDAHRLHQLADYITTHAKD